MTNKFQKYGLDYSDGTNTFTFFFLAPPDQYDGIDVECGVTKIEEENDLADMPNTKVEEILLSPVGTRKRLKVGITNGKTKYVNIVISSNKIVGLDDTLKGKNYKGGTIERVLDPRSASFY